LHALSWGGERGEGAPPEEEYFFGSPYGKAKMVVDHGEEGVPLEKVAHNVSLLWLCGSAIYRKREGETYLE